jgi:hypothetical protein
VEIQASNAKEPVLVFDNILIEMLVLAAKLTSLNANLSFGKQDKIIEDLAKLDVRPQKYPTGWNNSKETSFRNHALINIERLNRNLLDYPPYLLLRPFLEEFLQGPSDQTNNKIAELSAQYFDLRTLPYAVSAKNRTLKIHRKWMDYFKENATAIGRWSNLQFEKYLLARNETIEEIDFGCVLITNELNQRKNIDYDSNDDTELRGSALVAESSVALLEPVKTKITAELKTFADTFHVTENQKIEFIQHDRTDETVLDNLQSPLTNSGLFAGIATDQSCEAIHSAFIRLAIRINQLPAPRSLCELQLDENDFIWLKLWLKKLSPEAAQLFLQSAPSKSINADDSYTNRDALGALLLLASSELNRREGVGGAVWPVLLKYLQPSLQKIVESSTFESDALRLVRVSMKSAAEAFQLRNVFYADDHAQFLVTTFLQFGFTRDSIRLFPQYLARQNLTEAIRELLSEHSKNRSKSFCHFWKQCTDLLHRRISKTDFRLSIKGSPWYLPEWYEDIEQILTDPESRLPFRASLGKVVSEAPPAAVIPKLFWDPPHEPKFQLHIDFDQLRLDESKPYRFSVNGRPQRLAKSIGTMWRLAQNIVASLDERTLEIQISNCDGEIVFAETIELWEENDVELFDAISGKRVPDTALLNPNRNYYIFASSDLNAKPTPLEWQRIPQSARTLYLLTPDIHKQFQLLLDGDVLWSTETGDDNIFRSFSNKRIYAFIERTTMGSAAPVNLAFRGESELCRVDSVRVDGISKEIVWNGSRTELKEKLSLGATSYLKPLNLTLRLRQDGRLSLVRQKLLVGLYGAAMHDGTSWNSIAEQNILTLEECMKNRFLFNYKALESSERGDFGIFEGNVYRQRLKSDPITLERVSGNGGPLEIRRLFNANQHSPKIRVAECAVDPGLIESVRLEGLSQIRIRLTKQVSLSNSHQILIWADDSPPFWMSSGELTQEDEKTIYLTRYSDNPKFYTSHYLRRTQAWGSLGFQHHSILGKCTSDSFTRVHRKITCIPRLAFAGPE